MLFGKKTQLVGLDIGSRTIKAAEIAETKKGRTLKCFGTMNIPAGAIEEGNIQEPDVVADQIRQLFKKFSIKESNVAISIGGYSVIVKKSMSRRWKKKNFRKPSTWKPSSTSRLISATLTWTSRFSVKTSTIRIK